MEVIPTTVSSMRRVFAHLLSWVPVVPVVPVGEELMMIVLRIELGTRDALLFAVPVRAGGI